MNFIRARFSLPPSGNNLFFNLPKGGRAPTKQYKSWRNTAAWQVQIARKGYRIPGRYTLTVQAGRPDNRKRDLGNILKAIEDAVVEGGAVIDDSHSEEITLKWVEGLEGVEVLILPTKRGAE